MLGDYYQYDGTPILKAMYREMKECIYVEKDEGETKGVYWYRKDMWVDVVLYERVENYYSNVIKKEIQYNLELFKRIMTDKLIC